MCQPARQESRDQCTHLVHGRFQALVCLLVARPPQYFRLSPVLMQLRVPRLKHMPADCLDIIPSLTPSPCVASDTQVNTALRSYAPLFSLGLGSLAAAKRKRNTGMQWARGCVLRALQHHNTPKDGEDARGAAELHSPS